MIPSFCLPETTTPGLPYPWTPSRRIDHRNGVLAYAFNYGEQSPETLQQAIDNTRNEWKHD